MPGGNVGGLFVRLGIVLLGICGGGDGDHRCEAPIEFIIGGGVVIGLEGRGGAIGGVIVRYNRVKLPDGGSETKRKIYLWNMYNNHNNM